MGPETRAGSLPRPARFRLFYVQLTLFFVYFHNVIMYYKYILWRYRAVKKILRSESGQAGRGVPGWRRGGTFTALPPRAGAQRFSQFANQLSQNNNFSDPSRRRERGFYADFAVFAFGTPFALYIRYL